MNEQIELHSLVRVVWQDSNVVGGWHHHGKDTSNLPKIVTIGFVTHHDSEKIEVASTVGVDDGAKLAPLTIPWGCVTECKVFNRKGKLDASVYTGDGSGASARNRRGV